MYFSKLSLRNFGSFDWVEFSFAAKGLNVIQGANGTGKTQILGAIFAALLGQAAINVDRAGIGPAEVRLCIGETDTTEELSLAVEISQHGEPLVRQSSGTLAVDHHTAPLALRLLAAISDPTGSRILLPREADSTTLTALDIDAIERSLPDGLKRDPTWLHLRAGAVLQDPRLLARLEAAAARSRPCKQSGAPLIRDVIASRFSIRELCVFAGCLNADATLKMCAASAA